MGKVVLATFMVFVATAASLAEGYECTIQRWCDATKGCHDHSGGPFWFDVEADGSASEFAGHKSTQYRMVLEGENSRTFYSDDQGSFPTLLTLHGDGSFDWSMHIADRANAHPDEVGPVLFTGTCEKVKG